MRKATKERSVSKAKADCYLKPADVLVTVLESNSLWAKMKRAAIGRYSHVFLYLGWVGLLIYRRQGRLIRFPMLFESNGRGAVIQGLGNRYGQRVVVMRLKREYRPQIPAVLEAAVGLASDIKAYYDYYCIPRFILPRILCHKLGIPLGLKYQRDPLMICSEAVAETYWRASLPILPRDVVPLPGDFITSPLLERVAEIDLTPASQCRDHDRRRA